MRSSTFNDNLAKIFADNLNKEHEMEKRQKIMEQLAQTKHRNELWQQVKQANDLKTQLARSNMLMDEEYINM
jgi:predicted XRE-type DNA-binding protein